MVHLHHSFDVVNNQLVHTSCQRHRVNLTVWSLKIDHRVGMLEAHTDRDNDLALEAQRCLSKIDRGYSRLLDFLDF